MTLVFDLVFIRILSAFLRTKSCLKEIEIDITQNLVKFMKGT